MSPDSRLDFPLDRSQVEGRGPDGFTSWERSKRFRQLHLTGRPRSLEREIPIARLAGQFKPNASTPAGFTLGRPAG